MSTFWIIVIAMFVFGILRGMAGQGQQQQGRGQPGGGTGMLGTMASAGIGAAAGTMLGNALSGDGSEVEQHASAVADNNIDASDTDTDTSADTDTNIESEEVEVADAGDSDWDFGGFEF